MLKECLHVFLDLRWSGTNFNISRFLITVPILTFTDLYMSLLYSLPTILYTAKHKVRKPALSRLKFMIIFFYIYPRFSSTSFLNKLIASDLLMLCLIQQQPIFLTVITAISLILRHCRQIITTIAYRILKFESMLRKQIGTTAIRLFAIL